MGPLMFKGSNTKISNLKESAVKVRVQDSAHSSQIYHVFAKVRVRLALGTNQLTDCYN